MIKIKKILLLTTLLFSSIAFSQSQISNSQNNEITGFIKNVMKDIEIPGVAIAIIKDDEVVYKNYIGKANLEYDIPVTESSLFRLHSLSKIFVSVGIFQLIEQNKISLEDNISKYISDIPSKWKNVKIKNLLSHSSGLPDMREEINPSEDIAKKNVYSKDLLFPVGERASYNQTNFWLLNRIIRKITGGNFQDYITSQFKENPKVCFSNIADIKPDRVMEYKPSTKGELQNYHFIVQDYMYGCGGITMTLNDLINWNKKFNDNILLNATSKKEMLTAFKYNTSSSSKFTYGWDIQNLNGVTSYGFNGAGLVNYRKFPSKNISIIWLTNGYRKPHNIDNITNKIVGFIDEDLVDTTPKFTKALHKIVISNKPKKLAKEYYKLKKQYPYVNYERTINNLGYQFLGKKELDNAIALFKLNTEQFPESSNAFDSLAEGHYYNKQFELSKKNYLKSLELNPSNTNATKMISKIEKEN